MTGNEFATVRALVREGRRCSHRLTLVAENLKSAAPVALNGAIDPEGDHGNN